MPKIRRLAFNECGSGSPWQSLVSRLHGLVSVQTNAPFQDLKHLCLREAWLVLHLDLIHVNPYNRQLSRLVKQALEALAVLCVQSERVRSSRKRYEEFWRRVLTSEMSRGTVEPNDVSIHRFARFTQFKGLHLLLSWDSRPFQAEVTKSIGEFLDDKLAKYVDLANAAFATDDNPRYFSPVRSVLVGVRLANCKLSLGDVRAICDSVFLDKQGKDRKFCDPNRLAMLDFQGNRLGKQELSTIASYLETTTKQIDGLGFRNTVPTDEGQATRPEYIAQFKRVISLVFASNSHQSILTCDLGVSLSLAQNVMFDGMHLQALYEVLEIAKRPLRELSLAYTKLRRSRQRGQCDKRLLGQKWFLSICMASPTASFTDDCVLDVTMPTNLLSNASNWRDLIANVVPRVLTDVQVALTGGKRVECTASSPEMYHEPDFTSFSFRGDAKLSQTLRVIDVRDGWVLIETVLSISDRRSHAFWIPLTSVSSFRSESLNLFGMRFRGLVSHGDIEEVTTYSPEFWPVGDFIRVCGRKIDKLALRGWNLDTFLPSIVDSCPSLRELDIQDSSLLYTYNTTQPLDSLERLHQLESLNVSRSEVWRLHFLALLQVVSSMQLRYLSVLGDCNGPQGLEIINRLLDRANVLEIVELGVITDNQDRVIKLVNAVERCHLKRAIRFRPLSQNQLHALRDVCGHLGQDVLDNIAAFAIRQELRQVLSCTHAFSRPAVFR